MKIMRNHFLEFVSGRNPIHKGMAEWLSGLHCIWQVLNVNLSSEIGYCECVHLSFVADVGLRL